MTRDPLTPPDSIPEVKRLRMMTSPTRARRKPRHRKETPAIATERLIRVGIIAAILLGAAAALLLVAFRDPQPTKNAKPTSTTSSTVAPTAPATLTPSPSPSTVKPSVARVQPVASREDPEVVAARALKPLENLDEGDRVLYQGRVCTWQKWVKRMTRSAIDCDGLRFTTDTVHLTPVERR